MSWPREAAQERLPVRVRGVEYNDPFVTLFGDDWSLNLSCPWEGEVGRRPVSWEDEDLEDRIWEFVGLDLISVSDAGPALVQFDFSTARVKARPDTDLDPWVLQLPGLIIVGTMS